MFAFSEFIQVAEMNGYSEISLSEITLFILTMTGLRSRSTGTTSQQSTRIKTYQRSKTHWLIKHLKIKLIKYQ